MQIVACPDGRLPEVLELWQLAGAVPTATDDLPSLRQLATVDPGALLVALEDDRLLGSLIVGWDGWRGAFYRLAVLPAARRRGLATALVAAGEQLLARQGARRVASIVVSAHGQATGFWEAIGYVPQPDQARFVRDLPPLS
jgi:ribosomal protein S18 acetylase RimI-like enzyme